jgi:predicted RNA-binding Zn-ribbon protein involved in translation (DUF1610 family)
VKVRVRRAAEEEEEEPLFVCPDCGYQAPTREEHQRHREGLDRHRLECPRQDIAKIKRRQRDHVSPFGASLRNTPYGGPW